MAKPWVKATETSQDWDVAVAVHPFGIINFSGGFSDQNHAMQIVEPWFMGIDGRFNVDPVFLAVENDDQNDQNLG